MVSDGKGRIGAAMTLCGVGALYLLVPRFLDRAAVPIAGAAQVGGQFREFGDVPKGRGFGPDGARRDGEPRDESPDGGGSFWSSWNGSNAGKGTLSLGPFPAPRVLGLPVCGFTHLEGNGLYLENMVTSERLEVTEDNIGGDWSDIRLRLPDPWRGQPVTVHAIDDSVGFYGWLAVGSPSAVPAYAAWWNSFARKLWAFSGVALVLFLLQGVSMSVLQGRTEIPVPVLPLVSFALVALAAYGVFWVFCASALAGKVLSWVILGASACAWVWRRPRHSPGGGLPLLVMAAVGLLYFGLLMLYGSDRTLSDLGAHRYIDNLIYDNEIPHMFADRLIHGEDSRHLLFGWWLSTDRPPLQTACDLLLAYPVGSLCGSFEMAAQSAGIWMQLLWISAAWGFLRTLGVSSRGFVLIIAGLAPVGFFILNTMFVWPKLLSAAFLIGSFSIWFTAPSDRPGGVGRPIAWGSLAALGFLAHAGAAFSLLAWIPIAVARTRLRPFLNWVPAAAAFAVLVLPWTAYQHFYNPPGTTLIKRHLAGVEGYDGRTVRDALVGAYRSHGVDTLIRYRLENVGTLFSGPWRDWLLLRGADLAHRRNAEFYGLFLALGWWNLGFAVIGARLLSRWRGRVAGRGDSQFLLSVLWCLITLAVWLALMFSPGSTVIHQGSYACVLLLFLCLAWALWRASIVVFGLAALGGILNFALIWILPNPSRISPLHLGAAVVAALGAAAMVAGAVGASPDDSNESIGA